MACILVCAEVSVSIMMVVRRRAVADISFLFWMNENQILETLETGVPGTLVPWYTAQYYSS